MATVLEATKAAIEPIDVSLAELYAEDRWQEPFRKLRAEAPIQYVPDSKFGPYWSVSTYKPIVNVEALPKIFSSSYEYGGISIAFYTDRLLPDEFRQPQFIAMDPPQHTAQRRTIAPAFGPSEVKAMQDEVRQRTGEVLDSLPVGEAFDWVERLSIELTTGMLAKLFDFPWEERDKLTLWSNKLGDVELIHEENGIARRNEYAMDMAAAFTKLWERKAGEAPGKDLISVMMQSESMSEMSPEAQLDERLCLWSQPVSRRAGQAGGRSVADPQCGGRTAALADAAGAYAADGDGRYRTGRRGDEEGRQGRALVSLRQP